MLYLVFGACNYTSTYADGFGPFESDYQPRTLLTCNGKLYLLYHGGCPERRLYLWNITDDTLSIAGDSHGSESSIACSGDTLYVGYYHFGDSAITVNVSYDGGGTWNTVLVVDSSEFKEDEPALLLSGDTLYLTFVYEISGPEIQLYKLPIGLPNFSIGVVRTPYIAHNSPIFKAPNGDTYILAAAWDLEGGGYVLRYDGTRWHYGEVLSSGAPYDMGFVGGRLVVAGVSGPKENRSVVVCVSDTSLRFSCSKLAENVGRVTNVEVVAGIPTYVIWSDNSTGRFRLRMFQTEDLNLWSDFPLDDYLPPTGNFYYPVAALYNGELYIAHTTDISGRPSVALLRLGDSSKIERPGTPKGPCRYYDKAGRKATPKRGRVILGCGTGYIGR